MDFTVFIPLYSSEEVLQLIGDFAGLKISKEALEPFTNDNAYRGVLNETLFTTCQEVYMQLMRVKQKVF